MPGRLRARHADRCSMPTQLRALREALAAGQDSSGARSPAGGDDRRSSRRQIELARRAAPRLRG
ncbi:MAG: hypothetical protein MZW92_77670 [Comamonadaceae bacterium]|nr:hypothetical protein [Comamonadaceae bacterium]